VSSAPENKKPSLVDFYASRFGSNAHNLLDDAESDLARIADEFGIDWHSTANNVSLSASKGKASKLSGKDLRFLQGSTLKGKVAVWAEKHLVDVDGGKVEIPFISFVAKGGSFRDSFNGFEYLIELYKNESGHIATEAETRAREERLAKKEAERKERLAQLELKAKKREADEQKSLERDLAEFDSLATVVANTTNSGDHGRQDHAYAVRKRIVDALGAGDIRQGQDKYGKFLAIKAIDIHGNPRMVQKIYEQKFQKNAGDNPTDKTFTWAADKDGAFWVFGDLAKAVKEGGILRFVEGFATGASVYLASGDCVIVTFDAPNLKKVVPVFCRYYPNSPKIINADNDCWKQAEGKGNAGLLTGIDLSHEFGVKVNHPVFDEIDPALQPTDFNDVAVLHPMGLIAVKRMLRASLCKFDAPTKNFDYKLQRLGYVAKQSVVNEALATVNAGMMLVPFKYSTKEVVSMVCESVSAQLSTDDLNAIKRRARWLIGLKMKSAQGFRNFSPETLAKPNVRYEKVDPVINLYGHPVLPPKVLRKVLSLDGPIIIRAPMASGKTKHLLAPLMQQAEQGAYLAHRVSLIADACNRLAKRCETTGRLLLRVDNYQEVTAPMAALVERMGCCINSITHPKFSQFFAGITELLIDEASQTLRHVADGTVENPVLVLERLAELMRNANRTVMCDADASDALVEFCEKACPGQTIHIIEMATDCSSIEVLHTNDLMAHQSVIAAIRRKETVLVADDSAKDGAALAQRILTECPGTRVLHVHKDSKGETDVEAFLADPNGQAIGWDVVIYSPAISSGVSIETPHFKNHIGIFFGSVAPSDAVQMLRRDRTARRYIVGFHITDHKRETDKDRIYRGRVAADKRAIMRDGNDAEWDENDSEIIARWRKTLFDDVWLNATASERKARSDFANNMLLILHGDGYKVGRLESNPLDEEQASNGKKIAKAAVTAARHLQIMNEETPTTDAANRLMRRDVMSSSERAQLVRYQIENQLCVPEVSQEHIDFWELSGPKRIARFEILQADLKTCQTFDNHLADKGVTTTRRLLKTAQHRILNQVFTGLGIDIKSGTGEFTPQQMRDTMNLVLSSEAAIEEYNELNVGAYVNPRSKPKCATRWLKSIFERVGLELQFRREGRAKIYKHSITPESWALISDYATRRSLKNISSLAIHDDTASEKPDETATGDGVGAHPVADLGGLDSQVVFKEQDSKLVHLNNRYPAVYPLVERICRESSVLYLDEVLAGLSDEVWEDIQRGAIPETSLRYWLDRLSMQIQEHLAAGENVKAIANQ
jgi:phage/plasmid primase-like uncharacterized protein